MYKIPIVLFCVCAAASATTLQQLSMDQMTQDATSIVRARVTGSASSFTGSTIYTHYSLQVTEALKGAAASDVALPGGVASGYRQSFPGVPQLQTGTEYVLFLWKSPTSGITQIVGFGQGIFNVSSQTDGSLQMSRAPVGETMLDASGHKVQDHAVQLPISTLRSTIAGVKQ